jgi:hypothetical protein
VWVYCNYGCTCGESPLMFFGEIYIDLGTVRLERAWCILLRRV